MIMNKNCRSACVLVFAAVGVISTSTLAADSNDARDEPVDHATLHVSGISRSAALVVHDFDSSSAKLGKAKHHDTARKAARIAPHLLAVDIVEMLRTHGFTNVTLDESTDESALQLSGEFTVINPGSQATRVWIGLGAGGSKVCVRGQLRDAIGTTLGEFEDCEKGLGWGDSKSQTEADAERIGDNIARLLAIWAEKNAES